jgi:hypothetical protein
MPIDLNDLAPANPTELGGIEITPEVSVLAGDIARARPETPNPIGNIAVVPMPPVVAAGFSLAKYVLAMMSCSIIILMLYLAFMDYTAGSDISAIYSKLINSNRTGTEIYTLSEFDRAIADLSQLLSPNSPALQETAKINLTGVISLVDRLRSVQASEKETINHCSDIPSDDTRRTFVQNCINALDGVRQSAVDASTTLSNTQIATDFSAKIVEERTALHAFWIQTAQLILLNLLLPLLTALFGYVFGTQQVSKST